MERHEISIEVRRGGEVHVSISGVRPSLCRKYKEFFASVLQTTDEEAFQRLQAPTAQTHRTALRHHARGNG